MASITEASIMKNATLDKLRTIHLNGCPRSVDGLRHTANQFDAVARECDSSAHEMAAIQMRWAVMRITQLEQRLMDIHAQSEI